MHNGDNTDESEQDAHSSTHATGRQLFRRTTRGLTETENDLDRNEPLVYSDARQRPSASPEATSIRKVCVYSFPLQGWLAHFHLRTMLQRFENASEFFLDTVDLGVFVSALAETDHFLVYTGTVEEHGLYILANSALQDRPDLVTQILTKCFVAATQPEHTNNSEGAIPIMSNDPVYVLLISPREPFFWTGRVMNLEVPHKDVDLRDRRIRLISDGPDLRLAVAKQRFLDHFPHFNNLIATDQMAHQARVNRELKKIKTAEFKLAQHILGSVERVQEVSRNTEGHEIILANYFSFAADLGQRSIKAMQPKFRNRLNPLLMKLAIKWVDFICEDCVPSDGRTFKWAVSALEFAMSTTKGENILKLHPDDFAQLRSGVASCIALLISHFDILGARSSTEAKKAQEKNDAAKSEAERQAEERLAALRLVSGRDRGEIDSLNGTADGGRIPTSLSSSLNLIRDRWLHALNQVDERRSSVEAENRVVGRVLDKERPEDRSLLYLASSSSNISIRWQQGRFIGGGSFGSVYLAVNLDSGDVMAVKEIRFQDLASAPTFIKQIRDEMCVMEMLRHPNIVDYYVRCLLLLCFTTTSLISSFHTQGIEVHRDRVYM
jgi:mitogen-activated protein kinase kinase kinase